MTIGMVVPCFNEASRWNEGYWRTLIPTPGVRWLFVCDGSFDNTDRTIESLRCSTVETMCLGANRGKAEAVRQGLLNTIVDDVAWVGFLDADSAFSQHEVLRFISLAQSESQALAIWSSRVNLRGRSVERSEIRHYLGRVVATVLGLRFKNLPYDTQSGMKLFRVTPELKTALAKPFITRWLFDIELLVRLDDLYDYRSDWLWEEPVMDWREMAGSRINRRELFRILKELTRILKMR